MAYHPLTITTWEGANAAPESRKQIDWESPTDRRWAINHLNWCLRHNHRVELVPTELNPESN